jgi:formylglycine-generating enzyme required for sulfatase activity
VSGGRGCAADGRMRGLSEDSHSRMTPSIDQASARRILELADAPAARGSSRSRALATFSLILLLAAHAAPRLGFPDSAQSAAMSPAGAGSRARESDHMKRLMAIGVAAAVSAVSMSGAAHAQAGLGCPGDTNVDQKVDGIDLATVLTRWGMPGSKFPQADCNDDGAIDGLDLAIVLAGWGDCPIGVPSWATVLEATPNPEVVTNPALRKAITAANLAWRVRDDVTGIEMLLVPPGTFQMGSSPGDPQASTDEFPVRTVTLTRAFYLGRFETTQSQWTAMMGANPSYFQGPSYPDASQRPVDQVTWNAIQSFLTSTGMRLPTEAEWEFACRAGTITPTYASGNQVLDDIAWYSANAGGQTNAVGGKAANALGFHDMLGNVWEWTADWYGPYSAGAQTDPVGPATGTQRALRGAPWINDASYCRVSQRGGYWPDSTLNLFGFRVARNP